VQAHALEEAAQTVDPRPARPGLLDRHLLHSSGDLALLLLLVGTDDEANKESAGAVEVGGEGGGGDGAVLGVGLTLYRVDRKQEGGVISGRPTRGGSDDTTSVLPSEPAHEELLELIAGRLRNQLARR
jgi:hypothetical protein